MYAKLTPIDCGFKIYVVNLLMLEIAESIALALPLLMYVSQNM